MGQEGEAMDIVCKAGGEMNNEKSQERKPGTAVFGFDF